MVVSTDMSLSTLREMVKDREACPAAVRRSQRLRCNLATEQQVALLRTCPSEGLEKLGRSSPRQNKSPLLACVRQLGINLETVCCQDQRSALSYMGCKNPCKHGA